MPKEPFAERAYGLLEEETALDCSGSAGVNIPTDVAKHLEELRSLIDGQATK